MHSNKNLETFAVRKHHMPLALVIVLHRLGSEGADLHSGAHRRTPSDTPVVLGGVAADLAGRPKIVAHFVKAVQLFPKDGNAKLHGPLENPPGRGQLADIVPTDRVGAPEEERIIDGQVADGVAQVGLDNSRDGWGGASLFGLSKLDVSSGCNEHAVEEGRLGADAQSLVDLRSSIGVVGACERMKQSTVEWVNDKINQCGIHRSIGAMGPRFDGGRAAGASVKFLGLM